MSYGSNNEEEIRNLKERVLKLENFISNERKRLGKHEGKDKFCTKCRYDYVLIEDEPCLNCTDFNYFDAK